MQLATNFEAFCTQNIRKQIRLDPYDDTPVAIGISIGIEIDLRLGTNKRR